MSDTFPLSDLFQPALDLLVENREEFNRLDSINQNHGDHMLAIFQAARRATMEKTSLPAAMAYAGELLQQMQANASAQVYARGLQAIAAQFQQRGIEIDALAAYLRRHLLAPGELPPAPLAGEELTSGEILKALLNALTTWEQAEVAAKQNGPSAPAGLDLGYLLGIGMAYMQAKQGGGDKLDVLAETIVASSPLGQVPHRLETGKQVVRAVLSALKGA